MLVVDENRLKPAAVPLRLTENHDPVETELVSQSSG